MIKKMFLTTLLVTAFGFAHAQDQSLPTDLDTPVKTKRVKPKKTDRPNPCAMVELACKKGNFGKFIHRDCIIPILKGQKVPGVNTDDISMQQIKACQMEKSTIHY